METLILGGGAIGLSLAYELARRGRKVCLVERGAEVGREASWAGAGIVPAAVVRPSDSALQQLSGHAARLHSEWAERLRAETGIDNGYRRCGSVELADDSDTLAALDVEVAAWRARDIACRPLDEASVVDVEPALADAFRAGRIRAAYHVPDTAQVRNPRHVRALAVACAALGVEIVTDAAAESFTVRGERLVEVVTRRGSFAAEQFVLCTGAWSGVLADRFGVDVAVRPIRGQIVLFQSSAPLLRGVVELGRRYFVARPDGRVLVGSTEEDVGFDAQPTDEAIDMLKQFAFGLAPALRAVPVERAWAGLRPCPADGLPYVGRVPTLANTYVAAGHYRWGLTLSPATAVAMAQLLHDERPLVDLEAFRLGR